MRLEVILGPIHCPPCPQLLACLRVIVATPEELGGVLGRGGSPLEGPLSPENEAQVRRLRPCYLLFSY